MERQKNLSVYHASLSRWLEKKGASKECIETQEGKTIVSVPNFMFGENENEEKILSAELLVILDEVEQSATVLLTSADITVQEKTILTSTHLVNEINQCTVFGHFEVVTDPYSLRYRSVTNLRNTRLSIEQIYSVVDNMVADAEVEMSYPERIKIWSIVNEGSDTKTILRFFFERPEELPPVVLKSGAMLL